MVLCIIILIAYACLILNLIQLDSFIMGTNENLKNIHVSHAVPPRERENLRERRKEKKKKKKNEGSILLKTYKGRKKLSNISFPEASMSRKQ